MQDDQETRWNVYLILTESNTLYCGIAVDPNVRFEQHMSGRGAKYLRAHKPVKLVWRESGHSRSSALKRERQVKRLSRHEKERLIQSEN